MKKHIYIIPFILIISILLSCASFASPPDVSSDVRSAVLMEASSGTVLYEYDANKPYPPASVTKIMTLLLTMEAIDEGKIALSDEVSISSNAASMGGSQVYLEPGEKMSVDELIKCVAVASANDAAVALAEHVAGSEEGFIDKMNVRAKELGMNNTHFANATGLDDDPEQAQNHYTSAKDIAIMSRELLRHEKIFDYTTIWMDSIRGGEFGLTNTNRLIRFYSGANGLKTGSTGKALYCISATAKRDGMQLIAVIMGSPTRDIRNDCAKKLLDYGFAEYSLASYPCEQFGEIRIKGGKSESVMLMSQEFSSLISKGSADKVTKEISVPESVSAPIKVGEKIGEIVYKIDGKEIGRSAVYAKESIDRIGFGGLFLKLFNSFLIA